MLTQHLDYVSTFWSVDHSLGLFYLWYVDHPLFILPLVGLSSLRFILTLICWSPSRFYLWTVDHFRFCTRKLLYICWSQDRFFDESYDWWADNEIGLYSAFWSILKPLLVPAHNIVYTAPSLPYQTLPPEVRRLTRAGTRLNILCTGSRSWRILF